MNGLNETDNAHMERVQNGDLDALSPLFERYHHRLYAFFYRSCFCRQTSEDLVQAVFERILKYRHSFLKEHSFSGWIYRIARNVFADHLRYSAKGLVAEEEPDWETCPAGHESYDPSGPWLLEQALKTLSEDKRQALLLNRFEGYSCREIGEIMNCSESAVKVRIFRALRELGATVERLQKQSLP